MAEKASVFQSTIKPVLVMTVFSFLSAGLLALVSNATAEQIAKTDAAVKKDALSVVMPEGVTPRVENPVLLTLNEQKQVKAYPGFDAAGNLAAIAVETYGEKGYSGRIDLLAGFSGVGAAGELKVTRYFILQHKETPGLGSKATVCQTAKSVEDCPKGTFWLPFAGLPVDETLLQVKKDNPAGRIDGITASTITSRAVTGAVRESGLYVKANLDNLKAQFAKAGGAK
jgi:electron transport complex protein RnfG